MKMKTKCSAGNKEQKGKQYPTPVGGFILQKQFQEQLDLNARIITKPQRQKTSVFMKFLTALLLESRLTTY